MCNIFVPNANCVSPTSQTAFLCKHSFHRAPFALRTRSKTNCSNQDFTFSNCFCGFVLCLSLNLSWVFRRCFAFLKRAFWGNGPAESGESGLRMQSMAVSGCIQNQLDTPSFCVRYRLSAVGIGRPQCCWDLGTQKGIGWGKSSAYLFDFY